jgi:hypothetical protein
VPDVPVPHYPGIQQTTLPVAHQNGTLVHYHTCSRHVNQPITCPLPLILIVIVAICVVLMVLLLIFLSPLRALSEAMTVAIQTHQDIVSLAIVLTIVLLIVRLIQVPGLLVRWLRNKAEHAALVRLQNDQPIPSRTCAGSTGRVCSKCCLSPMTSRRLGRPRAHSTT